MSDPEQALQPTGDGAPAAQEGEIQRQFSEKEVNLLKRTICQGATNEELSMFIQNCKRYGLDPFTGQIHAVKRWDSNAGREVMSVQVGIDGFRLIADRTGKWRGTRGPFWCDQSGEWTDVWLKDKHPAAAKVGVLRSDFDEPRWGIARWDAYVATKKGGDPQFMWRKMPAHMLAKCAEALALRSAFPNDLSGLYTDAEMDQAGDGEKRTYDGPDPSEVQDVQGEVVDDGSGKATGASTGTPSGDSTTPSKTSTETHQDGSSQTTSDVESDDRSPTVKSRSYLQKARATGDPQTLSDAIETVRGRADEKLDGDEAARVKRSTIVFEAIGHLRASVQGDFQSIDESVFNNALDWFAQQTDDWPGDELQWAQEVVHDEVQRIVAQVPGFEVEVVDEDGPFEVEGDAPEQSSAEQATEAMQNGETALDAGGDTQPEGTEPEDASEDEGEGSDSGASDTPDASDREYSGPEAAIRGHFEVAIRKGNLSEIPQEDQISGKQVKRMYAIANEEGWKDSWLDRMVKDELGYESKSVVPSGPAYEEIIDAL